MASALATPHTATRPSSLSSSFGLSSSLSFMFMLFFWLFWLFWLVLLGFAFCSASVWKHAKRIWTHRGIRGHLPNNCNERIHVTQLVSLFVNDSSS